MPEQSNHGSHDDAIDPSLIEEMAALGHRLEDEHAAKKRSAPYWVKITVEAGVMQTGSNTEPVVTRDSDGKIVHVEADWIDDPIYGLTFRKYKWSTVIDVTWERREDI